MAAIMRRDVPITSVAILIFDVTVCVRAAGVIEAVFILGLTIDLSTIGPLGCDVVELAGRLTIGVKHVSLSIRIHDIVAVD